MKLIAWTMKNMTTEELEKTMIEMEVASRSAKMYRTTFIQQLVEHGNTEEAQRMMEDHDCKLSPESGCPCTF